MNKQYETYCHEGIHPEIIVNNAQKLTVLQFKDLLKRIRDYIVRGGKPKADDCTTVGNKHTECNWGVCTGDKDLVPYPELHTFPKDFDRFGRVSTLRNPDGHKCPMDRGDGQPGCGCFYSCRIFNPKGEVPTPLEAIELYNKALGD